jgi:hypothetical protein
MWSVQYNDFCYLLEIVPGTRCGNGNFVCLQISLNYSLNLPRRKVGHEGRRIPLRLVAFH